MSLKELKTRILEDLPLSHLISQYINVKSQGHSTVCVCPFHDDTNPSMSISDEKKIFKCFACGEYGNAIDFVVKYKNLDFVEALKEICQNNGMSFEDYYEVRQKDPKKAMAEKILNRVNKLYQKFAQTKQFPKYNEFLEKRGLSEQIATNYQLGYAPKGQKVLEYLSSIPSEQDREFAIKVATEIGLLKENDPQKAKQTGRSHYDTFRERIIFPIWDHYGQVIGFTSRAVYDYQKAKYMNSKDSFIFNKRKLLYGLHLAKPSIREKDAVLVVEGNMDQIALTSKGFENSVAVMGTAFGDFHIRMLKSLASNIFLCMDTDQAGKTAAKRANRLLLESGFSQARYVDFSPHKDADDFLKEEGRLALQKLLDEAPNMIDVELDELIPDEVPKLLDPQLKLLRQAFEVVAPLGQELGACERLYDFARRIGLKSDTSVILNNYQEFLNQKPQERRQNLTNPSPGVADEDVPSHLYDEGVADLAEESDAQPSEEELRDLLSAPEPLTRGEKLLLREMVKNPECLLRDEITELLDFVRSNEVKDYILRLSDLVYEVEENEYASVVEKVTANQQASKEIKDVVGKALTHHQPSVLNDKVVERLLKDIKQKLQEDKLKAQREDLLAQKDLCSTQDELNELMEKIKRVDQERAKLRIRK